MCRVSLILALGLMSNATMAHANLFLPLPRLAIAGALVVTGVDIRVEAYAPLNYGHYSIDSDLYADLGASLAEHLDHEFKFRFTEVVLTDIDRAEALVRLVAKRTDLTQASPLAGSQSTITFDVPVELTLQFPRAGGWESKPMGLVATVVRRAGARRFESVTFTSGGGKPLASGSAPAQSVLSSLRASVAGCAVDFGG